MPFPFIIYNLKGLYYNFRYCDVFPSNFLMPKSKIAFFMAALLFYNVLRYGVNKCCIFLNIYLNKKFQSFITWSLCFANLRNFYGHHVGIFDSRK